MELKDNNQFKKISASERNKIFSDLINYPEEIICKTDADFFHIKPFQLMGSNKLLFKFVESEKAIASGAEVICQFIYRKKNLYFFKTTFLKDRHFTYLDIDTDLFQIQRRDNYRFVFPESIHSKVYLKTVTDATYVGRIHDLSNTGIRVCFKDTLENVKINDIINLEINITNNETINTQAIIRHFKEETETVSGKKSPKYFYGMQFYQLSKETVKTLSSINMDLYRNFLSKISP